MIDSMPDEKITLRRHRFGISSLVRENGFAEGAEYFMLSAGDEIPSRCGDCYASQSDLVSLLVSLLRSFFSPSLRSSSSLTSVSSLSVRNVNTATVTATS